MKYNTTNELSAAVGGLDITDIGESYEPSSEYFPHSLYIEACQALASPNTLPSNQSNISIVQSKKFRLYSIPTPNLSSKSNVERYDKVIVSNLADIDDIEIDKTTVDLTNITTTLFIGQVLKSENGSISSISANTISFNELDSDIGILTNIAGDTVSYLNAQIDDLVVTDDISAELAKFDYLKIKSPLVIKKLVIESLYKDETFDVPSLPRDLTEPTANINFFRTNCQNVSEVYKEHGGGIATGLAATFTEISSKISSTSEISSQEISSKRIDTNSPVIGVYTERDGSLINSYSSIYNSGIDSAKPIAMMGRTKLRIENNISKFDRLEINHSNGKARKHTSGQIIGVALESGSSNSLIECVVLFSPFSNN